MQVPEWGYSVPEEFLDPKTTVKASGRELRISHKSAREICNTIKGMMLTEAKSFLRDVIAKRKIVPFKRFKKKAAHHRGLEKAYAGKYPVKAAKEILKVLRNAESNAENKGLDTERLKIIHASAYPGMRIKRYMPRAFGRATPRFETLTHVEVILEETQQILEEA